MASILRFLIVSAIVLSPFVNAWGAKGDGINPEAAKLLPDQIGSFKAVGTATPMMPDQAPRLFGENSIVRTYAGEDGRRCDVRIQAASNDAEAFALLTRVRLYFRQFGNDSKIAFDEIGTASLAYNNLIFFYRGNAFASVIAPNDGSADQAKELARQLANQLSAGEGEIPVLVKHLPQWETTSKSAVYSVSLDDLKQAMSGLRQQSADIKNQAAVTGNTQAEAVLDVLTFDGGTEAVAASYGQSQLVIVEFTTPQFSIDNDSRVWTKIAELKSQGQPTPSAYRRVGNYSVFVFNAPDEKTANGLIDQVKYEQVVQWLGDDPHLADRLQKYFTETSAGVLVAVLKSSGLSLVFCLAIGGVIGALLFRHRRAQRSAAFSDAGGSIRLNLDELTGPAVKQRLLSASERQRDDHPS
jgi:hypothetical protein